MIYLDSSAIIKLVVAEPDSAALVDYLDAIDEVMVTSELATVEVHRALWRLDLAADDPQRNLADTVLDGLELLPLAPVIRAAALLPGSLRSVDALHLATARSLDSSVVLVTYDQRLARSCTDAGVDVEAPTAGGVDAPTRVGTKAGSGGRVGADGP